MKNYTFFEIAINTLLVEKKPMSARSIWENAVASGLANQRNGQEWLTPFATLNAIIYTYCKKHPEGLLVKTGKRPALFSLRSQSEAEDYLKSSEKPISSENELFILEEEKAEKTSWKKFEYLEREIHPWLVNFAQFTFGAYVKTIYHEKSEKKSYGEWVHPDLVGFWFPFTEYQGEVLGLFGDSVDLVKFFSFEMKLELTRQNLRESFFQAVSNSSWAHEGYLVATEISDMLDFHSELKRLSQSFGIGVIELDIANPEESRILYSARKNPSVDWETANKIATKNPDFRDFLKDIKKDISGNHKEPTKSKYDEQKSTEFLIEDAKKWYS